MVCMSSGQSNAETCVDCCPTLTTLHEAPIVCLADDNSNAACDIDLCGSLKVGGGQPILCHEQRR